MNETRPNAVCAGAFMEELALAGVRVVCVAPGSRSTPLVVAAARQPGLRVVVHHDERCAAFFALGVGKASGTPAAVVTTSGTAVANLFPAVAEAGASETPLLLLTADRPRQLRGADANQTMDQVHLFGGYVRAFREMPLPSLAPGAERHVRVQAARSVADALGDPPGPVHVNFPFAKPLEPEPPGDEPDPPAEATGEREPVLRVSPRGVRCGREELDALAEALEAAERCVLVAGPMTRPRQAGGALVRFAATAGVPLLADPLSGARYRPHHGATLVSAYDLFLRHADIRKRLRPDLILRVGPAPTSAALAAWLQDHGDVTQTVLDTAHRWKDHGLTASNYVRTDPVHALTELEARVRQRGSAEWRLLWQAAGEASATAAVEILDRSFQDAGAVSAVAEALPRGTTLYVASSMPVRDLDAFAAPREVELLPLGNRGVSGIDGMVSAGLGASLGASPEGEAPTVVLLGDVAFHHDLTGLFAAREEGVRAVFVVIHNDGGGIFHGLPIRDHEPWFTPYFVTPHGLDFRHAAELYGVGFAQVMDRTGLRKALSTALARNDSTLIQVRTDAAAAQAQREAISRAVGVAVRKRLEEEQTR